MHILHLLFLVCAPVLDGRFPSLTWPKSDGPLMSLDTEATKMALAASVYLTISLVCDVAS